jgi:hypothetical protein
MMTAARIVGDQVASTAPLFLAFLAVHVLAGLTAVATGAVAALVRQGSPRHIRSGRWYYRAITVVFVTATVLAALCWRQDYYLFIIGAVAFTAATIGYQHRRRNRPGDTGHIAGMGIAYVAMLTAFYVDNGPHLPLWDRLPLITFWLLPSVIGAPIIARAIINARRGVPATPARGTTLSPQGPAQARPAGGRHRPGSGVVEEDGQAGGGQAGQDPANSDSVT